MRKDKGKAVPTKKKTVAARIAAGGHGRE